MPPIHAGQLRCWRCDTVLERATGRSLDAALACGVTTFLLWFPANLLPLLKFSKAGVYGETSIPTGVAFLWHEGWVLVSVVVALQVMILPFFRYGLLSACLTAIREGFEGPWIGPCFRIAEKLDAWAMPDVFLIGCVIGFSRMDPYVAVKIGAGGWCELGAAFMAMMTRASIDRRSVWDRIKAPAHSSAEGPRLTCPVCDLMFTGRDQGKPCPRCGERVWKRKPNAMTYAAALTLAGFILYPPANIYPMTFFRSPFVHMSHTIFTGVQDLVNAGLYPLAALIFTTSIAVPFAKLACMTWFLVSIRRRSKEHLVIKTKIYRTIDELGRWSNMDVYTVTVFPPMVQLGQLASFHVGPATPAFLAVVVFTMFASEAFDPRLMWDAAGENG